jgi:hypothetical protein
MDDFDTFKASREKIDPSARKFSKRQWDKAYAAYRSSRERVMEGKSDQSDQSDNGHSSKRRRSSSRGSSTYRSSGQSFPANLRSEVRHKSAYSDLRMMVDLLAWIAIALVVLVGALKLVYYTNVSVALVAILEAVIMVIAVVALRLLAHVVIDVPDIALQKGLSKVPDTGE